MVRYIIDTNAETIDDLKGFNYEGYAFDANLSKGNKLVLPDKKNSGVVLQPELFNQHLFNQFLMHSVCRVYFVFSSFYQKNDWNTT